MFSMVGSSEAAYQHAPQQQQQQQTSTQPSSAAESKQQTLKRAYGTPIVAVGSLRATMQLAHNQKQGKGIVKTRVKKLDKKTKEYIDGMLRRSQHRSWCLSHGKTLPPPRLHPVILRVIHEWFDLVDDDGSGTLEHHELLAALQAARIPCDANSISEMIRLMDANKDGCIGWSEFEAFMMDEFAAGKHLLSGEYVLPSGMALPFGVMIRQLKRSQMLSDITEGGESRRKWMHYNIDLSADAAAIAEAERAIRLQKAYDETLHNREVVETDGVGFERRSVVCNEWQGHPGVAAAVGGSMSSNGSSSSGGNSSNGGSSYGGSSVKGRFKGIRMPSWMVPESKETCSSSGGGGGSSSSNGSSNGSSSSSGGSSSSSGSSRMNEVLQMAGNSSSSSAPEAEQQLLVAVIAGVPVVTPRPQSALSHAAADSSLHGATAAAVAGVVTPSNNSTSSSRPMPAGVPKLQLSALTGSLCGSSSGTTSRMQQQQQQQQQIGALLGVDSGSVLASARESYWLTSSAAGAVTSRGSSRGGVRESIADHLFRQAAAAGVPLSKPGTPSLSGTARLGTTPTAAAAASSNCGALSQRGSSRTSRCISPGRQQQQQHNAGLPLHSIQPMPCKDTWGVAAASCLARSHSMQCESELHYSITCTSPKSRSGGMSNAAQSMIGTSSAVGSRPKLSARESIVSLSQGLSALGSSTGMGCYNCYSVTGRRSSSSDMLSVSGREMQMQLWQQQQQQQQPSNRQGSLGLSSTGCSAAAAAVLAAAQHSDGNYREAGMSHLLSVRRTPPATLLSNAYVGPITAAVAAAHTPRQLLNSLQGAKADAAVLDSTPRQQRQQQQQCSSSNGGGNTHRRPRSGFITTGGGGAATAAAGGGYGGDFFASTSGQAALAAAAGELIQGFASVPGVADVPGTAGKVMVATNNGGAVMTPRGEVLKYVNTPRQAAAAAAAAGCGSSVGAAGAAAATRMRSGPLATCIGLGLRQLDNAARVSCAVTSKNKRNQKQSLKYDSAGVDADSKASAAVTTSSTSHATNLSCSSGITSVGSSCANAVLVHSPRHGLLAHKLVQPHSVHEKKTDGVKQQQQGAGKHKQDHQQAGISSNAASRGSAEPRTSCVTFA